MNASIIRKQAERITEQRAAAQSVAEALTVELINTPGDEPLRAHLVEEINAAERRVTSLAEAEYHAWAAYTDASQVEHDEYLDSLDF